jgi:hypothetical protein
MCEIGSIQIFHSQKPREALASRADSAHANETCTEEELKGDDASHKHPKMLLVARNMNHETHS